MSFLLDTDICSEFMKGNRLVGKRMFQHSGRLFVSPITVGELYCWVLRAGDTGKRRQSFDDLPAGVSVLDVDVEVGYKFGEIRSELLGQGLVVPGLDSLLGATALVYDLTLVTHNTRDFQHIPNLRLEDWATS